MLAYLIIVAVVAFWLGIKASRLLSAALNKHYSVAFYIPRTTLTASIIGDDALTAGVLPKGSNECDTAYIQLYGFATITLELDAYSLRADLIRTRLCLHDFAMLLPDEVRHDAISGRTRALYRLPRKLLPGQRLKVWFFN